MTVPAVFAIVYIFEPFICIGCGNCSIGVSVALSDEPDIELTATNLNR